MVDIAIALGATGTLLGLGSLAYARTQAGAARRQADAAHSAARLELNASVTSSVRDARALLTSDRDLETEYLASAPPELRAAFEEMGGLRRVVAIRNLIDGFHDSWHLRRAGIVEDHYWRSWVAAMPPIARMPSVQRIFENAASRGAFDADFVTGFREIMRSGVVPDPRAETGSALHAPNARK